MELDDVIHWYDELIKSIFSSEAKIIDKTATDYGDLRKNIVYLIDTSNV